MKLKERLYRFWHNHKALRDSGLSWWVHHRMEDWLGFKARFQRFRRGWSDFEAEAFCWWFWYTVPAMLEYLYAKNTGTKNEIRWPDEWNDMVFDMLSDCRLARIENALKVCRRDNDGNPDYNDLNRIVDEHKTRFLQKLAEHIDELWSI